MPDEDRLAVRVDLFLTHSIRARFDCVQRELFSRQLEELPADAPQLNPEEYCHGNVKQRLENARPASKEEIRTMLDRGFARLRRRPDLLLGFFHTAGLSVRQLR